MACDAKTLITAGYAAGFGKLSYRHLKECILACACSQDPAVIDWANRVVANGGAAPTTATMSAASAFMRAIATIKSRIWHLNFIAPDSLIAMRTPLIATLGLGFWTRLTKAGGFPDILTVNGWKGWAGVGGSTFYNTGVTPSAILSFSKTNCGLSVYLASNEVVNTACVGGLDPTSAGLGVTPNATGTAAFQAYNPPGISGATPVDITGFYSGNRTDSDSTSRIYYGDSNTAWASLANLVGASPSGPSTANILFGAVRTLGGDVPCNQTLSFMVIHDGFISADGQILFNAVQALRVALGGGFS